MADPTSSQKCDDPRAAKFSIVCKRIGGYTIKINPGEGLIL